MFDLMPKDAKSKMQEIRVVKAFLIFAFVLCLLILYIEYQKYGHISWKFVFIQAHGLNLGILILTIGVLTPIASGKLSGESILKSFISFKSLVAIAIGLLVAWLGGRGVKLMSSQPDVVAGLLIGTVAGVALLRGVPVGPLIAAGLLSLFIGK